MAHSMDVSQPLSPATPPLPNDHQVTIAEGMEVMQGLSNMDFHSVEQLAIATVTGFQEQKTNTESLIWHLRTIIQLPGGRLINWTASIMILYSLLLLAEEVTSQKVKYSNSPMLFKFSSFNILPIILKQWVWKNGGMVLWRLSYSAR